MNKHGVFLGLAVALSLLVAAGAPAGAADDGEGEIELSVINIKYMGKILWLPSPIVARKGDTVKLTLLNNVPDDPNVHGFFLPDFDVKADVVRGEPQTVEFEADRAGVFPVQCHLHPAHLHGQLVVLDE